MTNNKNFKMIEIDVWINNGFKAEFTNNLMSQDIKDIEFDEIQRDNEGIRYSITFRQFSSITIPKGNWQVKNQWKLN